MGIGAAAPILLWGDNSSSSSSPDKDGDKKEL
jgi:hypothetical protein